MTKTSSKGAESYLVKRAQTGDTEAFSELATTLSPRLLSVARGVVGNREDAEDVVQVSLWKAYRHLPDYRAEAAFSTWLTRITVNEGVALLRKRRVEPIDLAATEPQWYQSGSRWNPARDQTPEDICLLREMQRRVRRSIERMDPTYKTVLWMRALNERSHEEIAVQLGLPVATVRSRVHRARKILRTMLTRRLHTGTGSEIRHARPRHRVLPPWEQKKHSFQGQSIWQGKKDK